MEEHLAVRIDNLERNARNVTNLTKNYILDQMHPVKFSREHLTTVEPSDSFRFLPSKMEHVEVWTMSSGVSYLVIVE